MSEAAARLSASAYGNPLRGRRDTAPAVPVGAPVIARVDVPDGRGWRVYRVAPDGAVNLRRVDRNGNRPMTR